MSRVAIWKQRRVLDTSHYAKLVIYIVPILVASGLLWYFRHSIYPMSATAVLKVIAYGAIPIALAWAGDHLAAEAVSEPRKKRMYRTFFVLFAALGIILIAKVEKKIEDDHATEVTQQKAEVKEQKANLKTVMSKMTELTADVSALEQRLNVPRVVVKRQTAPEPPPTEETRLHKMDSSQLRQYALDWAKKLRDFDTKYSSDEALRFMNIPAFGQDQAARERFMSTFMAESMRKSDEHRNDYKNNFWGETTAIYNELVNRYKAAGKTPPDLESMPLGRGILAKNALNGRLYGPNPIGVLADYIEILARGLP